MLHNFLSGSVVLVVPVVSVVVVRSFFSARPAHCSATYLHDFRGVRKTLFPLDELLRVRSVEQRSMIKK